jgi:amino acid adenylation domain-containing protein
MIIEPSINDVLQENLFSLFERQTIAFPNAVAVIDRYNSATYRDIHSRASEIASELTRRNVAAEEPIGVFMHRTIDVVATLLGILKAGACYVPLEPDDPINRTRRIVSIAGCINILGNRDLLEDLRSAFDTTDEIRYKLNFVATEDIGNGDDSQEPNNQHLTAPGNHRLAYIIFTSGTTGQPKGVEVEHRGVINMLRAVNQLVGFRPSDRFLSTSSIGFDTSVGELFLPLITGGSVVIHDRRLVLEPSHLANEIRKHGVTVFHTGPSVWSLVLAKIPDFPHLRIALSSSEAMRHALGKRMLEVSEQVWNLYGPTETIVWATGSQIFSKHVTSSEAERTGSPAVTIGLPFINAKVTILDENREPVPTGTPGELWIGGEALARGYRHDKSLTNERFRFLECHEERYYQTGDLVSENEEGILHFFGRTDDQIKVRGMRIEPMEVEAAVLKYDGVLKVAATWFENVSGSRSIVVGIVSEPGIVFEKQTLYAFLSDLLPPAMVPARFVFFNELPLTSNGKTDRKAIRGLTDGGSEETAHSPELASVDNETTVTENSLIKIWKKTLGIKHISRTDHFFSIGGDSLSAVMVMIQVEETFKIEASPKIIFEHPTLNELAIRIDERCKQPGTERLSNFIFPLAIQNGSDPDSSNPIFFCSVDLRLAQKGLWKLDCPLYAVELWAQGSGLISATSIDNLAKLHIKSIRDIQPTGPYRLAGSCLGGMIAFEIARQLRAAGEEIELLLLLDPGEPSRTANSDQDAHIESVVKDTGEYEPTGKCIKRHISNFVRHPWAYLSYFIGQPSSIEQPSNIEQPSRFPWWPWLFYHILHLRGSTANTIAERLIERDQWPAIWYALRRLAKNYIVRPYEGQVTAVFVRSEAKSDKENSKLHDLWRPFIGAEAHIIFINANHSDLYHEPTLTLWQDELRIALHKLRPKSPLTSDEFV